MQPAVYDHHALGLALSHRALERNLNRFVELADADQPPLEDLGPFVALYVEFLSVHHAGEDEHLFAALRRHGATRTTDVAHLDRWNAEHRDIVRIGDELGRIGTAMADRPTRSQLDELGARSRDLLAILTPHARDEEHVMSPPRLAEMIPAPALAATQAAIQQATRSRALALASFLATSLEPSEQRALMGGAPWLFRKVLLPLMGGRKMKRFRGLVHTPEISL